jgi:hypothetical protein
MAVSLVETLETELLTEVQRTRQAFMENATEETQRHFAEALERFKTFTLDGMILPRESGIHMACGQA